MARIIGLGAVLMFLAVAFGAFGAHALRDRLDEYTRGVYEKAVFYHCIHAIAILFVGLLGATKILDEQLTLRFAAMFFTGIVLFSGSLYLLAITGLRWFGAITPFGGTLFLVAWGLLAWKMFRGS